MSLFLKDFNGGVRFLLNFFFYLVASFGRCVLISALSNKAVISIDQVTERHFGSFLKIDRDDNSLFQGEREGTT